MQSVESWNGTTPQFLSGAYNYDGAGNIEAIGTHRYRYDKLSRLAESAELWGPTTYTQQPTFDELGNIQQMTTQGSTVATPTSPATNRLTSGAASYDEAGNQTTWNGATFTQDRRSLTSRRPESIVISQCRNIAPPTCASPRRPTRN